MAADWRAGAAAAEADVGTAVTRADAANTNANRLRNLFTAGTSYCPTWCPPEMGGVAQRDSADRDPKPDRPPGRGGGFPAAVSVPADYRSDVRSSACQVPPP